MATKNIQVRYKNGEIWDDLYPKTKAELVEGLTPLLDSKVDTVVGKGLSSEDFTAAEKIKLINIAPNANNYAHPTGAGNNHIPTGGAVGNFLKNSASGTATWSALAATDIPTLALAKISDAGTAASKNTGTASGNIPILDANGKLDVGTLPAIAITDTFVVTTQAAMLALTVEVGDVAVRTDLSKSFILKTSPATVLANWQELLNPTSPVQSVAGKTGAVTLVKGDVGLGNVENYAIATQAEAEAGTVTNKYMSPLQTKQAIIKLTADLGGGDMLKSVYDTNNNGRVDNADAADSVPWAGITSKPATFAPSTHQHNASDIDAGTLAADRLPDATGSVKGAVILNNTTISTSATQAATANAVRLAAEIANSKSRIAVSASAPTDADVWYQEI
ncbi:hypothetical protein BK133_05070 [Paenibacillus sp. FSL H8-0548]|uniref:tail fiber protein n=1 Tax=Paenibacillus sp. FSL H8-0548 TaxID=1920422 RepID=UPI00096C5BC7|nr:tail fiber protein [Paenibacillus sp. FSL H8-0548]OMF37428.1 hypothetical protein BK133_05070 [Paenibacillus sp. FSL H8-0548]